MDINNTIAPFKSDISTKKAINLDKDILPHEKNEKRKQNQLEENLLES